MKYVKKDEGYALLLVLLIIVLIGLFLPVIYSSLTTNSLQIKKTEETIQHNNLKNMGTLLFEKKIIDTIENWKLPEEWVPPVEWKDLNETLRNNQYIKPLIYQSLQAELSQLVSIHPQFSHEGYEFGFTSFNINSSTNKIELNIYTTIDDGNHSESHFEVIEIPVINFNYQVSN
ncbi:hypothetical protein [Sutcliffiella sp. NC1]|uniref:hypothetical protein n=1 Tax=Sutcliffiella sp. NC1 TaxID=3004096 RepID=UPI0022DD0F2E|nr:hypothetical protein [Sutcliffiella sp. NC1]WBL14001.1 hypothetical protein O1A01_19115 [Sutcliffiella sp. NC1]